MVAKGKIQPDFTYQYTCGNCKGAGHFATEVCPHCYNLDLPTLIQQFETARGERYYAIWKAILSIIGKDIVDEFKRIKAETGKVTPADYCRVLVKFNLPNNRMKAMAEWLEEVHLAPTGLYENLKDRGFKVGEVMKKLGLRQEDDNGHG